VVIPTMLVPGAIFVAVVFHFALITFGSPVMAPLGQGKGIKAMNYKELFLSFCISHIVLTAVLIFYGRISVTYV